VARGPLDGIRVIAVEQFGAGPWTTLQLADLGAEVIKIEDPAAGGDIGRTVPPYAEGGDSLFFEAFNRGKRSISLDLRVAEGRAAFQDLVREADAVFSNLRGDLPAKLGLDYASLGEANPAIVCCSLSGFGRSGPRAAQPAYDYVIQGLAGWMSLTGEPDSPPAKSGLSLVDFAGGYAAAIAMLAGLHQARATGRGCDCDISLFETALAVTNYVGTWVASRGFEPERLPLSAHPSIVPFQALPAADGWIVVACAKQKFWERLADALGLGELLEDERFTDFGARREHRAELVEILSKRTSATDTDELVETLERAGVPCGRVNSLEEALADPQAEARGVVVERRHPRLGRVSHLRSPLRLDTNGFEPADAPARGADTAAVLREICGYSDERLRALEAAGAIETASEDAPPC
jgi:crotonobetainyl-CoA:carnitine CoA-transferase CaiB-like acyl-CoA transferase